MSKFLDFWLSAYQLTDEQFLKLAEADPEGMSILAKAMTPEDRIAFRRWLDQQERRPYTMH